VTGVRGAARTIARTKDPAGRKIAAASRELHAGASLQAAREKYAGKLTFVSVGVPANQTPEKQKAYVEEKKLTGVFTFDRSSAAMKAFAVPHTSYIVVVGPDRRVVYTGVGDDQDIDVRYGPTTRR
jgi:hypothetical protein